MTQDWTRDRLPAPSDILGAALPDPTTRLLLDACLAEPAAVRRAWRAWNESRQPEDWFAIRPLAKRLGPLLAHSLARAPTDESSPRMPAWLNAARLHEAARMTTVRSEASRLVNALHDASLPHLIGRGLAASESAWPEATLRHCHDLDVLVPGSAIAAAEEAVRAIGWRSAEGGAALAFTGPAGVELRLHDRPLQEPFPTPRLDALMARSERLPLPDATAAIPAADDLLLLVCCQAMTSASRLSGLWVCDAHFIMERSNGLDWERLYDTIDRSGLWAYAAVPLVFLQAVFESPVPGGYASALLANAGKTSRGALIQAARSAGTGLGTIWRRSGHRSRLDLARWAFFRSWQRLRRSALEVSRALPTRPYP